MIVLAILRPNLRLLLGIENWFFSKFNLLPHFFGVKFTEMSLASFQNYYSDTVKSRKNYEKFGFFDFWLWSQNNYEIPATA